MVRADGTIPFAGTNYSGRNATWVDPTRKSPYAMNWNFGVQHTFATNYLVELTYTGNSSVNGFENREINSVSYDWANNLRLTNPTQFSAFLEQHADLTGRIRTSAASRSGPTAPAPTTTPVPSNSISASRTASRS